MQSNALRALAEVEAARGAYQAAYRHQLEQQKARDQGFSVENAARFQRLQLAQEAERQQRQILFLEQESALRDAELSEVRTTRTALGAIAALVIITLAALYARYRLKHESEARLRAQAETLSEALDRVQTPKGNAADLRLVQDDSRRPGLLDAGRGLRGPSQRGGVHPQHLPVVQPRHAEAGPGLGGRPSPVPLAAPHRRGE